MPAASLPPNEAQRLQALRALNLLDTPPEERFDRITRLAGRILGTPFVYVSLIDENRQFIKSCYGLSIKETTREGALCSHAIFEGKSIVAPDAKLDPRFADNILVKGEPHIRFYAAYPVAAPDGNLVGTLCVADHKPRVPSDEDIQALRDLAMWVQSEICAGEVSTTHRMQQETEEKLRESEARFREIVDIPGKYVWETTIEGKIQFLSDRVEEVLGYKQVEMRGRSFFESIVSDDAVIATAKYYYAVQKSQRFSDLEFRATTKSGKVIWLTARG